jgi:hypothetical protein
VRPGPFALATVLNVEPLALDPLAADPYGEGSVGVSSVRYRRDLPAEGRTLIVEYVDGTSRSVEVGGTDWLTVKYDLPEAARSGAGWQRGEEATAWCFASTMFAELAPAIDLGAARRFAQRWSPPPQG